MLKYFNYYYYNINIIINKDFGQVFCKALVSTG